MSKQQGNQGKKVSKLAVTSLLVAILGLLLISPMKRVYDFFQRFDDPGVAGYALWLCGIFFLISFFLSIPAFVKIIRKPSPVYGLNILVAVFILNIFGIYRVLDYTCLYKIRPAEPAISKSFYGSSDQLKYSIITTRLDEVIPENKNVIWCSSFQLAWNEMEDNIIKEPIEVIGAQDVADYLNKAQQSANDIDSQDVFAAAGYVKDGIVDKIQQGVAQQFPYRPLPIFNEVSDQDIIAYSCLQVNVPFKLPYRDIDNALNFRDALGNETSVSAFGLSSADMHRYPRIRKQVEILYQHVDESDVESAEYIIDLCKLSKPYQIMLACIQPAQTLEKTVQSVEHKISNYQGYERELIDSQTLSVPNMFWDIQHHFSELEQKNLGNQGFAGYIITEALQDIQFRLDRNGAELKSEATLMAACAVTISNYEFNHPFLVVIKKRDGEQPFFVMWVANAELLSPYKAEPER